MHYVFQHQLSLQLSSCWFHHRLFHPYITKVIYYDQTKYLYFDSLQRQYIDMIDMCSHWTPCTRRASKAIADPLAWMQCNKEGQRHIRSLPPKQKKTHTLIWISVKIQLNRHVCKIGFSIWWSEKQHCKRLPERNFRKVAPTIVRGFTVKIYKDIISEPTWLSQDTNHYQNDRPHQQFWDCFLMHARGFYSNRLPNPMAWELRCQ